MRRWENKKPKEPGMYETKHSTTDYATITVVEVVKAGRGLQCRPKGYSPCPMSDIGENELQWRKI